ncbi:MAG: phosphoribosylanthranilate isomerase [FCB group bacterium]|nr:phosphoribosylanthranilate isomerase [FCB group bacterium]
MIPVKICGITSSRDAHYAIDAGVSAIGLIFYPPSPRYVDMLRASEIVKNIPGNVAKVGVFVNEKAEAINAIADAVGLDFIQLHGDEDAQFCSVMRRPVIKAIRVGNPLPGTSMEDYEVYAFLLDTYRKGSPGGTGSTFDWNLVAGLRLARPLILAGGLAPDNVLEAIRAVKPAAVDINSGVEVSPGRKDPGKIKTLFNRLNTTGEYENIFDNSLQKA